MFRFTLKELTWQLYPLWVSTAVAYHFASLMHVDILNVHLFWSKFLLFSHICDQASVIEPHISADTADKTKCCRSLVTEYVKPCADLEEGSGGSGPPWNLQSLISPILLEMKKLAIFHICALPQLYVKVWPPPPPPRKIFW